MRDFNRVIILGNLTRDPEMRYTPSGRAVCSFSVATNRRWTDSSGNLQEAVEFHNVVSWGKLAEISSQILSKGRKVLVEGRLQTRSWEGQDGVKRNRTEIIAENLSALGPSESRRTETLETRAETKPEESGEELEKVIEEVGKEKPKKEKKEETKKKESPKAEDKIDLDDIPF